ncbi:hypothetical protein K7I13_05375 [Brucepastera parasyntrophica]|uniref:hypothetical protein n=1 Tax=Brucepastera parasyntrophica TaxID=2880008 RepID=UPI00210D1FC3|nr:hypothetical protein [Brucepastera parasyntrophica]ULQ60703.1 hypothetical protein K7I13_05375 [Brucepastera parasyntrophica]
MGKKKLILLPVLFFSILFMLWPVTLIPQEVFIGDIAECRFATDSFDSAAEQIFPVMLPPESLPSSPDATIHSITIQKNGPDITVSINFTPWKTGVLQLPPFFVNNVRILPPAFQIASLMEKTGMAVLAPPRRPLLVPGTTYLIYGTIAASCVIIMVLIIVFRKLIIARTITASARINRVRFKKTMKAMRKLEKKIRKQPQAEWYAQLSRVMRNYFGLLCRNDPLSLLSSTGPEIAAEIKFVFFHIPDAISDSLLKMFEEMDMIRFSGRPFPDMRKDRIHDIRQLLLQTENAVNEPDQEIQPHA